MNMFKKIGLLSLLSIILLSLSMTTNAETVSTPTPFAIFNTPIKFSTPKPDVIIENIEPVDVLGCKFSKFKVTIKNQSTFTFHNIYIEIGGFKYFHGYLRPNQSASVLISDNNPWGTTSNKKLWDAGLYEAVITEPSIILHRFSKTLLPECLICTTKLDQEQIQANRSYSLSGKQTFKANASGNLDKLSIVYQPFPNPKKPDLIFATVIVLSSTSTLCPAEREIFLSLELS